MSQKPDLSSLLDTAGSTRRQAPESKPAPKTSQPSREGTVPITGHFPPEVRDQIKILAIEQRTTMHKLLAEAFNDLFAKHGKPEIAPKD